MNFSTKNIHIIGCGSLGSTLIQTLSKEIEIENVYLYDKDVVTKNDLDYYTHIEYVGIPKIEALRDLLLNEYNIKNVFIQDDFIYDLIDYQGIVFDCRDNKNPRFNNKNCIRLSTDSNLLIIDTLDAPLYSSSSGHYKYSDKNSYNIKTFCNRVTAMFSYQNIKENHFEILTL